MALKNELKANHVWTTGTTEDLDALVEGYLNNGWKLLTARQGRLDPYNRLIEMVYLFVKAEYVHDETEKKSVTKGEKVVDKVPV